MGEGIKRAIAATKRTRAKAPKIDEALHSMLARIVRGEVPQDHAAAFVAVVGRAALAAASQSKAEVAWNNADGFHPRLVQLGAKAEKTQRETCEAGAALVKALRGAK